MTVPSAHRPSGSAGSVDLEQSGVTERPSVQPPPVRVERGVRMATPEDAHHLAWVLALSWQMAFEHRLVPHGARPRDFQAETRCWEMRITHGALPIFVATQNNRVVAFAALAEHKSRPNAARIQCAHALIEHWQDRTPDNLTLAVRDFLTSRGYTELWIDVLTDNAAVQWLLTKQNFELREALMRKGHMHTSYCRRLPGPY